MPVYFHTIPGSPLYSRIVSLVPSQTELLFDLGLEENVAGITKFCVHPAKWRKTKTIIGGTKNVRMEVIHKLNPDLIIASKEENNRKQMEELGQQYDVLVTDVKDFASATQMIVNIGLVAQKKLMALQIFKKIETGFENLKQSIKTSKKIKTAYLIWKNPYMAAGGDTFINDMMQYCGLENVYGDSLRYPEIKLEELSGGKRKCELIILSSEPYSFKEKHVKELQTVFPEARIMVANGEMFSWYGSRLIEAPEYFILLRKKIDRMFQ